MFLELKKTIVELFEDNVLKFEVVLVIYYGKMERFFMAKLFFICMAGPLTPPPSL